MGKTPWVRKHAPKSSSEIIGQNAVAKIKQFIQSYKTQKKKALLVYGAPGSGKTSAIYAIASELNLEIMEINASDFRNDKAINAQVGAASQQLSLFSKGKVILVDEVDGISGQKDRGGVAAIVKQIAESNFPVIMTANDPFDKKFSTLRKKCEMVEFEPLSTDSVFMVLKKISSLESIETSDEILMSFARRSGGDLRGTINDLQTLSSFTKTLSKTDLDEITDRDKTEKIELALLKVFKTTNFEIAKDAYANIKENLDEIIMWVDENVPQEYVNPEYLANAYDCISKADVYKGRIRRWQYWRFLVYINLLLSAGVAISKEKKSSNPANYKRPGRILKLFIANMKYNKRKAIAEKIGSATHTSSKYAIQNSLPYLKQAIIVNPKLADELDLNEDEVDWLKSH